MSVGKIRIGTSNITLPGSKETFPLAYRDKSRLNYYSSLFNTVEVNSSFYKSPLPSTYNKWALDTKKDFQFSIKISKDLTHVKELKADLDLADKFLQSAESVGDKKGCLLIQFPGKITLDHFNKVEEILNRIHDADHNNSWRKAVEFRSASWYTGETYELLREHQSTIVLHDIPKGKITGPPVKLPFIYLRFHGPEGNYRGSYGQPFLKEKAAEIKAWQKKGLDVYAYFNNTIGSAFDDARLLQKLVK